MNIKTKTELDGVSLVSIEDSPAKALMVILKENNHLYIESGSWWVKAKRIYTCKYGICTEPMSRMKRLPKGKLYSIKINEGEPCLS